MGFCRPSSALFQKSPPVSENSTRSPILSEYPRKRFVFAKNTPCTAYPFAFSTAGQALPLVVLKKSVAACHWRSRRRSQGRGDASQWASTPPEARNAASRRDGRAFMPKREGGRVGLLVCWALERLVAGSSSPLLSTRGS